MGLVERVKSKIKELIKQKGLSIYEVAEKSDLTEACIRNWYTKRNYTPSMVLDENLINYLIVKILDRDIKHYGYI